MYVVDGIAYAGEREQPLTVVALRPIDDYKLWVRFSSGTVKVVDFLPILDKGAFQELKDKVLFDSVYIDFGVPNWKDGEIDIAPEYLYEIGTVAH